MVTVRFHQGSTAIYLTTADYAYAESPELANPANNSNAAHKLFSLKFSGTHLSCIYPASLAVHNGTVSSLQERQKPPKPE